MQTVRLGIAGLGKRATTYNLAPTFKKIQGLQVAAACDVIPERASEGAARLQAQLGGEVAAFSDYDEFINSGLVDALYLATPNYTHADLAVAACEAGLDVITEKPMATTLADCDRMIDAAQKHGRVLAVCQQMNYRKRYHKVTELIDAGKIGEPAMLSCVEYRCPFADTKTWVWQKAKSGGAIVEKNCHHYGLLDVWAKGKPTRVFATGGQKAITEMCGIKSEVIDNAYVTCDYDSGARSLVGICFLSTKGNHLREFVVMGTKGRIWFNHDDGETIHFVNTHTGEAEDFCINEDARGGPFQDFVDCVRNRTEPLVTGALARASLIVPIAAQQSMETGLPVDVSKW